MKADLDIDDWLRIEEALSQFSHNTDYHSTLVKVRELLDEERNVTDS